MRILYTSASIAAVAVAAFGGSARAAVIFQSLSVSSSNQSSATATAAPNALGANVSYGSAYDSSTTLPASPLTAEADAIAGASTTAITVVHHPDTYAANDPLHKHPIHHADTYVRTTTQNAAAEADDWATAALTSASAGQLSFGGAASARVLTSGGSASAWNAGQEIIYNFKAIGSAVMSVSYALSESYNFANVHNLVTLRDLTANTDVVSSALGNNVTGLFTANLVNGHSYSFDLTSSYRDDYAARNTIGATFGSHSEVYDLTVTPIPEPAGWALMIGGFALTGAALRRRREALAAA